MRLRSRAHRKAADVGRFTLAGRARLRDRVATRVRSRRLDSALAGGTPAEASAALAHRARQLTALSHRRALADAYRLIVREARHDVRPRLARVALRRREVTAAGEELSHLAEFLAQPGPVSARGAAEARLLLTDGTGPLYNPGSTDSLRARAVSAAENLVLRPPPAAR